MTQPMQTQGKGLETSSDVAVHAAPAIKTVRVDAATSSATPLADLEQRVDAMLDAAAKTSDIPLNI